MDFGFQEWKNLAGQKLGQIGAWLERRKNKEAPYLLYGALCSLSLWPLVEMAQAGQLLPVVMALGNVAGGVGGNLLAEQIQRWKDRADQGQAVTETEVTQWLVEQAQSNEAIRETLDEILLKLEAIPQAQAALPPAEQSWFQQTLRGDLIRLDNLTKFELVLSGVIVQGENLSTSTIPKSA